jgi:RNA polymerase sigma-70 factor (ECF subfamily)
MHEAIDEDIAKLVQQGDREAFGLLVERYRSKIERYVRRFLFNTEDAQDIVQEVFIKAYVNIQSFDPKRKFSSWLYRIAHNESINALKKKGRERMSFIDFDVLIPQLAAKETADADVHRDELRAALDGSLEKLSAKYREPLVLYYFEDMDYKEIADVLRIPVATVGVRLRRGRARLQSIIERKEVGYGT